jgi:CDP-diacylglycerol---glycerol-3-phosphate 3-phosphatidyltransferase
VTEEPAGAVRERRRVTNWNVPNALTTLRIVAVPFFGWALLTDGGDSPGWRWVALAVFALAMLTDKIDGDLARKHDLVTDFGKIADPIADKALTGMAFVGLSIIGELWWWVTAVVLLREWGITLMRLWLAMLIAPLRMLSGPWDPIGEALWWVAIALMGIAVALTVVTGADYVRQTLSARREQLS